MTKEEQKQIDQLQEQLAGAKRSVDELRATFGKALRTISKELRLYRGLFWCLLAFAAVSTILRILER